MPLPASMNILQNYKTLFNVITCTGNKIVCPMAKYLLAYIHEILLNYGDI